MECDGHLESSMMRGHLVSGAQWAPWALWICAAMSGARALAADPPPTNALASVPAAAKPLPAARPLDLRVGDIRKYMTPEEFRALLGTADESNTVIVKADAPLAPMKSQLDVPGGLIAPFWALAHPTQAWRLFLPDARVDISKIPPPESKIPPPEFRWGP
jgi:hypothetical protein